MNIFICATPYHVLLSHVIREQFLTRDDVCYLILTDRALPIREQPIVDTSCWHDVLLFDPQVNLRNPIRARRRIDSWVTTHFKKLCDDAVVYTGNDTDWRFQLLISSFPNYTLRVYEDGIGSYVTGWNNFFCRQAVRTLLYKPLFGKRYFNFRGCGNSRADAYYALRSSAFPATSQVVNEVFFSGSRYASHIREQYFHQIQALQIPLKATLLISQDLTWRNQLSAAEEHDYFAFIINHIICCFDTTSIWIKKHPNEVESLYKSKVARLTEAFVDKVQIKDVGSDLPSLEILLICGYPFEITAGAISTALASVKLFHPDHVTVSCASILSKRVQIFFAPYVALLTTLGVTIL